LIILNIKALECLYLILLYFIKMQLCFIFFKSLFIFLHFNVYSIILNYFLSSFNTFLIQNTINFIYILTLSLLNLTALGINSYSLLLSAYLYLHSLNLFLNTYLLCNCLAFTSFTFNSLICYLRIKKHSYYCYLNTTF
jgi:hypothetical protein